MDTLGIEATPEEVDLMIDEIDQDNNGEIDFEGKCFAALRSSLEWCSRRHMHHKPPREPTYRCLVSLFTCSSYPLANPCKFTQTPSKRRGGGGSGRGTLLSGARSKNSPRWRCKLLGELRVTPLFVSRRCSSLTPLQASLESHRNIVHACLQVAARTFTWNLSMLAQNCDQLFPGCPLPCDDLDRVCGCDVKKGQRIVYC